MEFTSSILPLTKNLCRTCLTESDITTFMNIQDVIIEHEMNKVKLIDILVFLNCLENNDEENWPQGICPTCVTTILLAYNFKLNCLKANSTLTEIHKIQSPVNNVQRTDSIDINVVYQDHEYDVPLFSHHSTFSLDATLSVNKELTPLPPVTEITSTEQPPRTEGEKKYACTVCSKSFTRIYGLRYHMNKHTGIKLFLCSKCGKSFNNPSGFKQHLRTHKDIAKFKCGFCHKTYKAKQGLQNHFRVAHSSNRKLFICAICGKRFTTSSSLVGHTKIHNGEKSFACPNCPKVFTRALYLRTHSLVHTGQEKPRPFHCSHSNCDRSFSTKHSLSVHIAFTHTLERPHKCDICLKGFATPGALRLHKEIHMSRELYCQICNKRLSNKRVLLKHMKTHDINANDKIVEL